MQAGAGEEMLSAMMFSTPEFLCILPAAEALACPLPAAEAAQRVKTVAADPEVLLPGRERNRRACQPGGTFSCVAVQALAALCQPAKGTGATAQAQLWSQLGNSASEFQSPK